ncbi:MAG: hypothetical protein K2N23_03010 [Clostridia bacterium]|nr:hypothetical protein [Clostridia bacterium]
MIKFSTAPTRNILDKLGCPDEKLKIIHIAGTNGKGSTAEFFTRILIAVGKKVGTFTSPEVYSFYDQFKIDGEPVTCEVFDKYRAQAVCFADGASEFEIITAAAISAFAGEGCEWAVIECGMGGLNDATNAIAKKELAVITSISLEHTAFLGNTVKEICFQKAGIIKNCPAIINAHQSEEAREFFKGYKFADKIDGIFDGGFIYGGKEFTLNAFGCLQPHNAACAIEGARILKIDEAAIYEGIKNCYPRGRLEKFIIDGREYILDGAHNPAAFEPLKEYLFSRDCKRTVIFGCLNDKDIDGNLANICANEIIAVACPGPRARTLEETYAHCRKQFGKRARKAKSLAEALDTADGEIVAVCGSFTLLKEAYAWIEKRQ